MPETREMEQFLAHLKKLNFQPRTVIDVGVAYGTPPLYDAFPDAYFYLFEVLAEFEPNLKQILQTVRGEYHLCGLAEQSSTGTVYVTEQTTGASLVNPSAVVGDPHARPVPTRCLDDVFAERMPDGPVLLKTDCQGGDLNVIKGGKQFVQRCDVVIMEVGMFRYWGGTVPDFAAVVAYMREEGFVPYDFFGFLSRPLDGALGQLDVAFVKDSGPFRASHEWLAR
jgi:FkbM family methyltransferase